MRQSYNAYEKKKNRPASGGRGEGGEEKGALGVILPRRGEAIYAAISSALEEKRGPGTVSICKEKKKKRRWDRTPPHVGGPLGTGGKLSTSLSHKKNVSN